MLALVLGLIVALALWLRIDGTGEGLEPAIAVEPRGDAPSEGLSLSATGSSEGRLPTAPTGEREPGVELLEGDPAFLSEKGDASVEVHFEPGEASPPRKARLSLTRSAGQGGAHSASLNDAGEARIEDLAAGSWKLTLSFEVPEGAGAGWRRLTRKLDLEVGEHERVLFGARDLAQIEASVTTGGAPATGLELRFRSPGAEGELRTEADGSFSLRDLPLGDYLFLFGPDGGRGSASRSLSRGGATRLSFELPGNRLEVLVLDAERRRNLADVRLELQSLATPRRRAPAPAITARDGVATFEFLEDGDWRLIAQPGQGRSRNDFAAAVVDIELEGDEEQRLLLQLARGPSIEVRVLDGAGQAVADAQIYWRNELGYLLTDYTDPANVTDSEGRVRPRGLPLGPGALVAKHFEYGVGSRAVVLAEGENPAVEIRLAPLVDVSLAFVDESGEAATPLRIHSIRDEAGDLQPFARISKMLLSGVRLESRHAGMETDQKHVLHIGPLSPGRTTFAFQGEYGILEEREIEVPPSEEPVTLEVALR